MADIDRRFAHVIDNFACEGGFSAPSISTATIVIVVPRRIDLDVVRENETLQVRTKKGKNYRPFSNSVTIMYDTTKTVKVFTNGKLHITGCTTMAHAESIASRFLTSMDWADTPVTEKKILTLNTTLHIAPKAAISLGALYARLATDTSIFTRYTPDIYQGLIVKKETPDGGRKISILFFYTGSVIVCGVQRPEELALGLSVVRSVMEKHLAYVRL